MLADCIVPILIGGSPMTIQPTGVKRGAKRKPLVIPADVNPPAQPAIPDSLGEVGAKWWNAIWIGGARFLSPTMDHLLVEMVCVTQDQIAKIEKELERDGRYYNTPQGHILAHPAVGDLRNLKAATVSWLGALCFSPSDRKQLGIMVDTASSDALAEFKKRVQANRDNL